MRLHAPKYLICNNVSMYRNVSWRTGAQHNYSRITAQFPCAQKENANALFALSLIDGRTLFSGGSSALCSAPHKADNPPPVFLTVAKSAVGDIGSQAAWRPVWIGHLPLAGNLGETAAFQIGELTLSTLSSRSAV